MFVKSKPRGNDEAVELAKVRLVEVGDERARWRSCPCVLLCVPRANLGPARQQRSRCRETRPRQTIDRIFLVGEGLGCDHLSLSVLRPARASTKLMIQKRITTVGSDQPRCSKWWWMGAIKKTRLPVRL